MVVRLRRSRRLRTPGAVLAKAENDLSLIGARVAQDPDSTDDDLTDAPDNDPDDDPDDDDDDDGGASSAAKTSTSGAPTPSPAPATTTTAQLVTSSQPSVITAQPTVSFPGTEKQQGGSGDGEGDPNDSDPGEAESVSGALSIGGATATSIPPTAQFQSTIASSSAAATTSTLASSNPTYIVEVPPPPPQRHHDGGLSEGTEKLLIAAGSIGATILVVLMIFVWYKMRTKGITIRDVFSGRKWPRPWEKSAKPDAGQVRNWTSPSYAWGRKMPFGRGSVGGVGQKFDTSYPLARTVTNLSSRSRRPLTLDVESQKSSSPPMPSRSPSESRGTFLEDDSPISPSPIQIARIVQLQRSGSGSGSNGGSSPTLAMQTVPEDEISDYPKKDYLQTLPPPPPPAVQTFREFLSNNRRLSTPKISRFSWTTSQAPQTPRDPRDIRDSIATSRSSVPRFRTIESWVSQQAGRLDAQRLREQFARASARERLEDQVPDVPNVPKHLRRETESQSDITIFRQHPGQRVKTPRGSMVPSEILNQKIMGSVL